MSIRQIDFRSALLDPLKTQPPGLSDGHARPAGRRFDVYRNNVAVSLTEALHEGFPVIAKLLGDENMDGLAGAFLRAHPPMSPLMMQYGNALPDFIAAAPQLAHLQYLPDVARLELALRRAYHAKDAAPIDPIQLGGLAPDDVLAASVQLAPAASVLRSEWPVFDIWRYNVEQNAPKPKAKAQDVLITRPGYDPRPMLLPEGGATFTLALAQGDSLGQAHSAAEKTHPGFDPGPCLSLLLEGQAITQVQLKD